MQNQLAKLKKENELLKKELNLLSNTKLIKELKQSMERIEKGNFLTGKEFFENGN